MATSALIPISEYLCTAYEPDAEYVDGYLEEKARGERDHSGIQKKLVLLLSQLELTGNFVCYPELRVQVSETRYRLPDVCLLRANAPWEDIVLTPPLLCIEVLSPEDTMSRTMVKIRDYLDMGVPEVWILDPESRTVQLCRTGVSMEQKDGALVVPQTSVSVSLTEVFSVLRPLLR